MNKKRGLGKGLEALLPVTLEDESNEKVKYINVADVIPNTKQPRKMIDESKLQELADSIHQHGVVQPIVVRPLQEGSYEIIAGERRWRACLQLNMEHIPAIVREYGDLEATAVALIENIQREDLNPMEEAMAYRVLMDDFGLTQEDLSKRLGKSRSFIGNMVRLLSLPLDIKTMLMEEKITAGHARAVLGLNEQKHQMKMVQKIVEYQLNVRQTEKLVKAMNEKKQSTRKIKRKPYKIKDIENQMTSVLSTNVKITSAPEGGGKIVIQFNGEDDLKWLVKVITGQEMNA